MRIGPYVFDNNVALAPMAGVTDEPFRRLCKSLGAGWTVSEMVNAKPELRHSRKTRQRLKLGDGSDQARIVQIVGTDPATLADAARFNVDQGAQIIDINMGCPAKKVCSVAAGSALMQDEVLVGRILEAVVEAVDAPVTLKIRTGWDRENRNGPQIARIAELSGIQALAMHGRTRADRYSGEAEYDTLAKTRAQISIPLIANGDIRSPGQAREILDRTGADAVMIGRAAQGRPWLPGQIAHYLEHGTTPTSPDLQQIHKLLAGHLQRVHAFYGDYLGPRIARKHIGWHLDALATEEPGNTALIQFLRSAKTEINRAEDADSQLDLVRRTFDQAHSVISVDHKEEMAA